VLDDLSTGRRENLAGLAGRLEFLEGDVRDRARVAQAVAGCEVVYHLAALAAVARSIDDPRAVTDVNVGGTLEVLLAAKEAGARRVVFASSSSVYGDTPTLPKTETMTLSPRSPYAATKAAGEGYLQAFGAAFGLEGVSLRFFNVYGPRQSPRSIYAAVVPLFIEACAQGRAPTIHGDGEQTRDFTYVADVVDAVVRAGSARGAAGQVMNVGGGGRRVRIRDLARVVGEAVGWTGTPVHDAARPGDVKHSLADVRRAKALLDWEPRVPLEEGIARTVAAFRAR
jgi:nucleoside-diphosphate-sugar epimerase